MATFAMSCIFASNGVNTGYPGICLPHMVKHSNSTDGILEEHQIGIFNSILAIGCIVGSFSLTPLMVQLGQRNVTLLTIPVSVLSWLALSQTNSFVILLTSRFFIGVANGVYGGSCTNYVSEISHQNLRGRFTSCIILFAQLGILGVYMTGNLVHSWRNVALIAGITPFVIAFPILLTMPHSPRWLATQYRYDEAESALIYFRCKDHDVRTELKNIQINIENTSVRSIGDQLKLLQQASIRKRCMIIVTINCLANFTGSFVLISYAVTIFQEMNMNMDEYFATIYLGCAGCIATLLIAFIIDKIGRKPLTILSFSTSGVLNGLLAIYFYLLEGNEADFPHLQWLLLSIVIVLFVSSSIAWSPIVSIRNEMFPNTFRAAGIAISLTASYFCFFLVTYSYMYVTKWGGSTAAFALFALSSFLATGIICFCVPETKGKSLEEIEKFFDAETEK